VVEGLFGSNEKGSGQPVAGAVGEELGQLRGNDLILVCLRDSFVGGEMGLRNFPGLLKKCLKEGCWRRRAVRCLLDQIVEFDRFEDYVTETPPEGLGADLRTIKNLCHDDKDALSLIDKETANMPGNPTGVNQHNAGTVDNVHSSERPSGNSCTAALRRLRKDRPDLHAQVIQGEKSANRAMIEAGFRKMPTALETAQKAWAKLSARERKVFLDWARQQ
jgi:hypothetical protein